jgi:hypothetical protein
MAGSALFTLLRSVRKPPVRHRVEEGIDDLPADSVARRLKQDTADQHDAQDSHSEPRHDA